MKIKQIIIFIIQLFVTLSVYSHPQTHNYFEWIHIPSKYLIEKGSQFSKSRETADSSLIYATVVCNRYSSDLNFEEKYQCCNSYLLKWYLYFVYYNDFSKAYESILKAEEIRKELKIEIPLLDMDLGCFYEVLANQSYDISLKKEAMEYYKKALKSSYKLKDEMTFNSSFSNILSLLIDDFKELPKEWELYRNAPKSIQDSTYNYNKKYYRILSLINKKKFEQAASLIDSISIPVIFKDDEGRLKYMLYCLKSHLYEKQGNLVNAVKLMKLAEKSASEYKINEMRLDAFNKISDLYKSMNDRYYCQEYKNRYLSLKDSLFGYGQILRISEMSFLGKIDKMNVKITEMKQKREIQNLIILLVAIVLIVILTNTIILYFKNKELSSKNKSLYLNYKELSQVEEQLRQKIKKEENNTKDTKYKKTKYLLSSLQNEEDKEILLNKILNVMEDADEICSSTFSTERLAELTGTQYKYISQVINEKYGCSFNALLNKYRIKEVCRRFSNFENYGNYTTEAISESVGFKNRTTFINAFKKETGMTPYQYLKLVKNYSEK